MVWYNGEMKSIADELEDGAAKEMIEEEHGCLILLLTDADYQSRLNGCIASDAMILDLYIKDSSNSASGEDVFAGKVAWQAKRERYEELRRKLKCEIITFGGFLLLIIYAVLLILYRGYIRPFHILQEFTAQVAKGNLELALPIRRNNFFGCIYGEF